MAKFWVAIESKTFEVSIEEIKGKLKGIIVERSRGFSSWIRFGVSSLRKLLECFEECCREEKKGRLVKVWEEEGRKFRLERRVNGAGRYVLCSVVDVEAKRFCLVFPEGKGVIGGWAILAEKLRALGIVTKKEDKGVEATQINSKKKDATLDDEEERCIGKKKQGEKKSFLDVAKGPAGRVGEELWLQAGGRGLRRREEVLGRCLVGRWEGAVMEMELDSFKNWGKRSWNLRKGVKVMKLGEPFFLLEFEDGGEAERVLNRGTRRFKDKLLHLERWNEEVGPRVSAVEPMMNLRWREGERVREKGDEGSRAGNRGGKEKEGWQKCDGDKMGVSADGLAGYSKEEGEKFIGRMDNRGEKWASRRISLSCNAMVGLLDNRSKVVEKVGQDDGPSSFQKDGASSCLEPAEEFFAEDSLVGGMGPSAARGTPERCSITDECFLEEASRCGREVILKDAEEGLSINPLSMRPAEERMGEKSTSGFFPLKDGRKEWGEEEEKDMELWNYSCLAKFFHCLGMPTEGCERDILKLLHKMRDRRDRSENLSGKKRKGQRTSRFDRELKKLEWSVNYSGSGGDRGYQDVSPGNKIAGDDECNCEEFRGRKMSGMGGFEFKRCGRERVGVVVFWDNRVLQLEEMEVGNYSVSCRFKNVEDGFCWAFFRKEFLSELGAIKGLWNEPWCVVGDFNMIRFPSERSRGGRLSPSMRRFTEVIEELESIILQLFLMEGMTRGPHLQIREHVAEGGRLQRGLEELVGGIQISGTTGYILSEKLKALKPIRKNGTRGFGQIKVKKQEAWNSLDFWDKEERVRELSLEEEEARKEAREMYKKWVLLEETSWRQKSREIWLKEGDRNTSQSERRWYNEERRSKRWCVEYRWHRGGFVSRCGEKAPGPTVFNGFWQFSWDFVKEEVMNFFRQFHEIGSFVRSLNATFLVLIPKKGGAEDLKDFRPISLVGGLYKWLAKVLANRMKGVLAKVISTAQNTFVEGRQIMDAVLVANEAIDSIVKSNRGAILCKLDIEKAYDHVDWDFLLAVMEKMGFGERWCRWIKWCLSTVSGWGVFGALFDSGKKRRRGPDITLVSRMWMSWLMSLVLVGKLPSTYLGMPLGAPFKSVAAWDGIEERFRKKLAMWKRQYISKGGRITLVRSTLANLPIYFMSIFQMPRVVRIRLEKIQRDFLWGGGALVQKPHLVKWSIVCLDKRSGGLGVKNLGAFNRALLGKWVWRFANERKALWNQVIRGKYGEERGGWRSCEPREAYGFGLWKAISKMGHQVTPFVGFVVGDGEKVKFWKDKWCETIPLSEVFPSLFALASNKEAWVNEVWTARGEWGELGTLTILLLGGKKVRGDEEDKVKWMASKDGDFSPIELRRWCLVPKMPLWREDKFWILCLLLMRPLGLGITLFLHSGSNTGSHLGRSNFEVKFHKRFQNMIVKSHDKEVLLPKIVEIGRFLVVVTLNSPGNCKQKGERGSPCFRPLKALTQLLALSFTKIAKVTEDKQPLIQDLHLKLNPFL
ncbi:hypothetical protein AAG906_020335 [Vitis piasezkii]